MYAHYITLLMDNWLGIDYVVECLLNRKHQGHIYEVITLLKDKHEYLHKKKDAIQFIKMMEDRREGRL